METLQQKSTGRPVSECRVSGAIHVYVKQDSSQQPVKVETDENLQDLVEIYESNGVLYISPEDNYNLDPTKSVTVYVAAPIIKALQYQEQAGFGVKIN